MRILVISPHIDDETLGAGGYILQKIKEGNELYWLNITNINEEYGYDREAVSEKSAQVEDVNKIYKFSARYDLNLEPAKTDQYRDSEIIEKISGVINEIKPEILLVPYENDIHSDHRNVYKWMCPFTKSFRYPYIKKVLQMEILSETEFALSNERFTPNYFVDITEWIDKKIEIMKIYKKEIQQSPLPRSEESIRALARYRGGIAGVEYAESFKILKWIE